MPFIDKAYRLGLGLKSLAGCVLRGGEKTNAALSVGRVTQNRGFASKRHKEVLSMAKGYRGRAKNCFKIAVQRVEKALQYAYRDRKTRRREFRREWITTLNAASRQVIYHLIFNPVVITFPAMCCVWPSLTFRLMTSHANI
eukprot:58410_1